MNKMCSLLFLFVSCLFSNTLSIGSLNISYKITNNIDEVYFKNNNSTLVIEQNNLWNDAETRLNLFSANKEKIQISMQYIGNRELGYIYTFKNIDNKLIFNNAELYQLDANTICKIKQNIVNKSILKLIETNKCKTIKKVGINLDEISYVAKNFKLKNILTDNEIRYLLNRYLLTLKTLTQYNNIAYYLQKAGANKEAIYLLEKIIEKYPNRTVAYINLGDAYWDDGNKIKAKEAYKKYIKLMKDSNKEKKIPNKVKDRIKE